MVEILCHATLSGKQLSLDLGDEGSDKGERL